jgi:GNAT superfamily N-acetyltransferase
MPAPASHAWRHLRRVGPGATLRAFTRRYIYGAHQHVVLRGRFADTPAADRVDEVVFRLATPEDLGRLQHLQRYGRGSIQAVEVAEGHSWVFVACDGDRIVATRRYCDPVPAHELMARVVRLEPGQIWADDVFCLPEYRNRGIGLRLGLYAEGMLATLGYREVTGAILATNAASLRMTLHKSTPVLYVSYFRFLFYERLRVSTEPPAELTEPA